MYDLPFRTLTSPANPKKIGVSMAYMGFVVNRICLWFIGARDMGDEPYMYHKKALDEP